MDGAQIEDIVSPDCVILWSNNWRRTGPGLLYGPCGQKTESRLNRAYGCGTVRLRERAVVERLPLLQFLVCWWITQTKPLNNNAFQVLPAEALLPGWKGVDPLD